MNPKVYLQDVSVALLNLNLTEIQLATNAIRNAERVFVIGNGGSASTASHFAVDLIKMCGIKAFALADNIPVITAYGNDDGWENMFLNYLDPMMAHNDVLVAISTSGNSKNVIQAVYGMMKKNRLIIALTKNSEANQLRSMLKDHGIVIVVNCPDMQVVEDVHLAICHAIVRSIHG